MALPEGVGFGREGKPIFWIALIGLLAVACGGGEVDEETLDAARREHGEVVEDVVADGDRKRALELLERHRDDIALVFTDTVMPEMGGAELVARLRRSGVPVLVLLMDEALGEVSPEPGPMADQPDRLRVLTPQRLAPALAELSP